MLLLEPVTLPSSSTHSLHRHLHPLYCCCCSGPHPFTHDVLDAGCLALPFAFNRAGLLLGSLLICAGGFVAFVSVTFVVEALSTANAIQKIEELQPLKPEDLQITKSIEVGEMAAMFLGTTGLT